MSLLSLLSEIQPSHINYRIAVRGSSLETLAPNTFGGLAMGGNRRDEPAICPRCFRCGGQITRCFGEREAGVR